MKSADLDGQQLIDEFGRQISYLRVSLTSQCNLRCVYCYSSIDDSTPDPTTLTDDELIKIIRVFASLGVQKVRFTGGEPLVRPGVVDIIRRTAETDGISVVGITTNGMMLKSKLHDLADAGLNGLNISLDTLDKQKFIEITGVDGFDRVFGGIAEAISSDLFPIVKVNTVVIRGINDDEISRMAEWALSQPIDLRFIEYMPTLDSGWGMDRFVSEDEMRERIGLPLVAVPDSNNLKGPAKSYRVDGEPGRVSFISAVSHTFCSGCNRLRLTSDGEVVGCLFGAGGVNLKALLDSDDSGERLRDFLISSIKKPGFRQKHSPLTLIEQRPCMRRVGG